MPDELSKLIEMFRDKGPVIKVGILENTAHFQKNAGDSGAVGDMGTADIGAVHEFGGWSGGHRIPRRSFLRMPLETQFQKFLKSADITEETIKRSLKAGNFDPVANKLARVAKACVDAAFESGGFGFWPPHSPDYKTDGTLLVDTGQLKAAVSTEIIKKS